MQKQKTKVVEINGGKYRLGKLDARSASYLAFKLAAVIAPAFGKNKGSSSLEDVASAIPDIPRKEFDEMQTMLLKTVCILKEVNGNDIPSPVLKESGAFADEDLAYDSVTVMKLTVQALVFNVGSFFSEAGLTRENSALK